MARVVGTILDASLLDRLSGRDLARTEGQALVVISIDEAGWPHPALLSYHEVVARDDRNIRLATYQGTTLARAARRGAAATLAIYDADTAACIKGTVTELAGTMATTPYNAKINLHVTTVLSDDPDPRYEAGVHLTGGITFRAPDPAQTREIARRVIDELLQ